MPDIAMCNGERSIVNGKYLCPRAKDCYRHTAKPTPGRQSYFAVMPLKNDGVCDYFWPTEKEPTDAR